MPNGNINSDALDSLFDPKGNVVLEQFEDSAYGTTAVLLRPESAAYRAQTGLGDPYVVAYGYDKETGEWSHGYYTSNLSYAVDRANPEILEEATIKWQREDFEAALEEKGLEPSKRNTARMERLGDRRGQRDHRGCSTNLDSSKEPKEYGIDQLMADLSDETPETGEDGPGGRD